MIFVIEIVGTFLVMLVMVTQVLIPAYMNRRLFPMFNKPSKIEQEIVDANEQMYEQNLAHDLEEVKKQLQQIQQSQQTEKE